MSLEGSEMDGMKGLGAGSKSATLAPNLGCP